MNLGTKIRTLFLFITSINLLIFTYFHPSIWLVFSVVSILSAAWIGWYFNEDLTEDACIGTGITRQMKLQKRDNYIGDFFFEEEEEEEANE